MDGSYNECFLGNPAPQPRWWFCLGPGPALRIASVDRPNAFHRFMQGVFLGIRWEPIDGPDVPV